MASTPNKKTQSIRKEDIENKIKKKIIKKLIDDNKMPEKKKKKAPIKRVGSGLDRLNKTKESFESISSGGYKVDNTERTTDKYAPPEEIRNLIKGVFQQELPKLIREGSIDIKSLLGNNGGINRPIGSNNELMKMMDILSTRYQSNQSNNVNNATNPFEQLKQTIELARLMNPQQNSGGNNIQELLLTYLLKQKDSPSNNAIGSIVPLITQLMQMNEKANNYRLEALLNQIGSGQPSEPPEEKLMKSFEFYRALTGDNRQRTKDEMEFDLKRQELILREKARQDLLDREERQTQREDAKSERILSMGGVVLDKIVGNGLGNLVGDLMSAKGEKRKGNKKGSRRGRTSEPEENFDFSLLDDL